MIPASAVIAGQNMSTSSALGPGSSVLARVPVTRMSFVAVRALSQDNQDNRVETQSQVSDRRDTPQQAIHVLNALFKNRSHVPKNLNLVDFHSAADYTPLSRRRDLAFSLRSFRLA